MSNHDTFLAHLGEESRKVVDAAIEQMVQQVPAPMRDAVRGRLWELARTIVREVRK